MDHLSSIFLTWLGAQTAPVLYSILFLSAVTENLFPPVPGDTVTAFGAFLVGTGKLHFLPVYISTTAGSAAGFFLLFFLARTLGHTLLKKRKLRWLSRASLNKAQSAIGRSGYLIILTNRFLPGVRSAISIAAGLLQLPPGKVLPLSIISAAAWNLIWIAAGYTIGNTWTRGKMEIEALLRHYNAVAGIIIFLFAVGFTLFFLMRHRRKRKSRGK